MNKNQKKILHISPTDIRYDSRILKELIALQKLKNIDLLAFGINNPEGHVYHTESPPYIKAFTFISYSFKIFPRPIRYFLNLLEAFLRMVLPAIIYRPDIIHCHDTLYLPIAKIIKFFCNSKLIYDAHELESDKAGQSKILSKYTLLIEKLIWKDIDVLISVSPSIINWYETHLGNKKSVLILNAPIQKNINQNNLGNNFLRRQFDIPTNKKIFLYLGIINDSGRGIKSYLEVFQKKEITAHIVFVGYGEYVEEVKKYSLLYENIHYLAAVPHDQVLEVANSADVGLCLLEAISLSDYYALPNKLFEYAFSDLYLLASNFPDIKKIVEEYQLGQCCGLDFDTLFQAVLEIQTKDLPKTKTKNLFPLSWEFQEQELINLYNQIININ